MCEVESVAGPEMMSGVLASSIRIHRVLDAADGEAEKLVEVSHPRGVAACEVVVDGDELDVLPRKRVQVERQSRDERLAFARLHL